MIQVNTWKDFTSNKNTKQKSKCSDNITSTITIIPESSFKKSKK